MDVSPSSFDVSSVTHAGKVRVRNEDSCLVRTDTGLWAVADGMGGHEAGDLSIDEATYSAKLKGRVLDLTFKEFELLKYLAQHPGRVFTRAQVLNRAWGDGGLVTDRTIDVHVKSLRKKFGKLDFIETVRGIGYRAREL